MVRSIVEEGAEKLSRIDCREIMSSGQDGVIALKATTNIVLSTAQNFMRLNQLKLQQRGKGLIPVGFYR